jgi:WD40 repeat protein
LAGHENVVESMGFSPDGRWLATVSDDDTARLWDVTAGDPGADPVVLVGHENAVSSVAFSPDGRWLATASRDNTARLWTWQVDDLLAVVCRFAGRNLSGEEWERYFQGTKYRRTCSQWPTPPGVIQSLRDEANLLAQQGDVAGAVAAFEAALALAPDLSIDPQTDAKRIFAQALVEQGRNLAHQGEIERATASFAQAVTLDPSLALMVQVGWGQSLAARGAYTEALTALANAQTISPTFDITNTLDADGWNGICWYASLAGAAADALPVCERAVALAPDNGGIRDSRGLARALTGDTAGAIEDFEFFIKWAEETSQGRNVPWRIEWIAALQAGKNPFDAAMLEQLRGE